MHPFAVTRALLRATCALTAAAVSAACSGRADESSTKTADTAATAAAPAVDTARGRADSAGTGSMAGMAMTGNPDQDFLRMMSDHHKGLVLMSHETLERKEALGVKEDARKLDREQDEELDRMGAMLKNFFNDSYAPKVSAENKSMVDAMQPLKGTAYDSTFRENVIKHHRQGIQMMDEFYPKLTRAEIKTMVDTMKAAQQKEIDEMQRKIGRRQ